MRVRFWLAAASLLALSGCVSLNKVSAGYVGCNPDEIAVSNDQASMGARTWNAECRGRRYICSAVAVGQSGTVSCKPIDDDAAASATATGGCKYDTQCKGDRICVSGSCVDPVSSK